MQYFFFWRFHISYDAAIATFVRLFGVIGNIGIEISG